MGYYQPQVMQQQATQNKPTAAAVLSILAGIFGMVLSLFFLGIFAWVYSQVGYYGSALADYGITGGLVGEAFAIFFAIFIWTLVASILALVGGTRIYSHPNSHTKWGVIILIFSIIGLGPLVVFYWIFGLPIFILGLIGGILALAFKPVYAPQQPYGYQQPYPPQQPYQQVPPQPYQQPSAPQQPYQQPPQTSQQIKRICPQCGRVVDENLKFCPYCGKQLS